MLSFCYIGEWKNIIKRNDPYFSKISCDFKKLEAAGDNYSQ